MKKYTFIFALIAVAFSSCKNLVPFTDSLKTQHNWSEEQVKHMQFFTSHEISLTRKLVSGYEDNIHGKVVIKNGERVEQVYFPARLKVGFVGISDNGNYVIQCERQDGCTLTFGVNPKNSGKFVLLASEWGKNGIGKVHYAGVEYYTDNECQSTCLLVDLRKSVKHENSFHQAKGFKVK